MALEVASRYEMLTAHTWAQNELRNEEGSSPMRKAMVAGLIGVGTGAAAVAAYLSAFLPWQHRWGATDEEVYRALPGDELVPQPDLQWTRAITIQARDDDVWPWLVQIGAGRSGYYSYPWIETLMGLRVVRPLRITAAWQRPNAGDVIPAESDGAGYRVMVVEPPRVLVLGAQDTVASVPWSFTLFYRAFTWAFVLEKAESGETRLIMRMRARLRRFPPMVFITYVVDFGAFFLKRKMLLSLKQRAEATFSQEAREARQVNAAPQNVR
jgi:hypothetical protein